MELNQPDLNVIEISLFGTGGGYGESIVIHCPGGVWIVVDSCIDPKNRVNVPLNYLRSIGVDLLNVELVVATHWHDDHIMGLSEVIENCPSSKLVLARCTDHRKFLKLVGLDIGKTKETRSTAEYFKSIKIIKQREFSLKEASSDRRLLFSSRDGKPVEVISLSPSDYSSYLFDKEISTLMRDFGPSNKKIVYKSPNSRSIVLLIKAGSHRAILGADLEVDADNRIGWKHIIDHSTYNSETASLFKVPHHGSENGYSQELWEKLIDTNPKLGITPWNRNSKLPRSLSDLGKKPNFC